MARARNIKPAFFKNELLAECPPLARLLFVGLWCVADREGRLEDRPKRLKVEILPYDDCDVDELLGILATRGFIERYVMDDVPCILIPAFKRHQNPHHREASSILPDLGQARPEPAAAKSDESLGLSQGEAAIGSGSAVLIPSSLLPITDSMQEHPPGADEVVAKEHKPKDADLFPGVGKDVIRDFRAMRRAKKAPITMTAMAEIRKEAELAGLSLQDALTTCCARGWTGFNASWLGGGVSRNATKEPPRLPELTA